MTNKELLERAISFRAGMFPCVNQFIMEDDDNKNNETSIVTINYRGPKGWSINYNCFCLNKITRDIEYESSPSNREDDYIDATRFPTVREAFEFWKEWSNQTREDLKKNPNYILWKDYLKTCEEK